MRKVKITIALGILLVAGIGAVTLTRAPVRVVHESGSAEFAELGVTIGDTVICQSDELLPAGVTAIRLPIVAFFGTRVNLIAFEGKRVLTAGARPANWTGASVTVPVKPLDRAVPDARICFAMTPNSESILVPGNRTPPLRAAVALKSPVLTPAEAQDTGPYLRGRLPLEFLASGRNIWWSRILTVARHMGLGRFYSGTWIALLVAALVLLASGLGLRLTLREFP